MKAFIEKIFKARKEKSVADKATEAVIESIITEVKEQQKPKHVDCECAECIKRIKNNAK